MKTIINSSKSKILNVLKQSLYALQVMIIALAIPVLSYIELSHSDSKNKHSSFKSAGKVTTVKSEAIAYNQTIK